jgi:hypothetical protein
MNVANYLINQEGKEWSKLLSGWLGLLPPSFTIWFVNRFGDVIAVFEDESVHLLNVGVGSIEQIADNREHFISLIGEHDNATDWLLVDLTDQCVAAGFTLKTNQCYSYKIPPILGGAYEVANVAPADLAAHYSFLADIYSQTKDLPDRTKVEIVVKNVS